MVEAHLLANGLTTQSGLVMTPACGRLGRRAATERAGGGAPGEGGVWACAILSIARTAAIVKPSARQWSAIMIRPP
jgi:hypothetical protein